MTKNISRQVIAITEEYLGPAAEGFISRLSSFHLNKPAAELTPSDIGQLTEWIKVSLGMLTDDKALVDDCVKKLQRLAN